MTPDVYPATLISMTTNTETMSTAEMLTAMLTENTGIAMCDSGGEGGRLWQRNQGRDFSVEPATVLRWSTGEWGGPEVTHNVYHWLLDAVDYEPEMDALFGEYAELPENKDEYWLSLMEGFPAWLAENYGDEYGLRPSGDIVNTYNGEDLVSQTLQYLRFTMEGGDWVYGECLLLQIHGGADVRGGYTRPRAFSVSGRGYPDMFDNACAHIDCAGDEPHAWSTDDGYNWYPQDDEGFVLNPKQNVYRDEVAVEVVEGTAHIPGKVVVTPDGVGLCPVCGAPLSASF